MTELLTEGDVIEIRNGHEFYTLLPEHYVYADRTGVWDQIASAKITAGKPRLSLQTDYFLGRYIVTKTTQDGGSSSMEGGHHVYCTHTVFPNIRIDFYQTGSFTAMIKDIKPIGKATMTWMFQS